MNLFIKNLIIIFLFSPFLIQAQSLLQNGTFDTNLDHWGNFNNNFPIDWVGNDGAPASGNGSIKFGSDGNNGGSIWVRSDLVPIKPRYHYIMATSYKRPADSVANGLNMSVYWYDDAETFLGEYPWNNFFDMSQPDVWLDFEKAFENIISGVTQARVYLWVNQASSGTALSSGLFDDVIFFQDTVFMSDFD